MAATTTATTKEQIDSSHKTLSQHEQSYPSPSTEVSNDDNSPDADASSKEANAGSAGDEELKVTSGIPTNENSGVGTDTLKKQQRAERFGMPVQLSEKEKRSSRAERFGTGPELQESDTTKKSEEHKRKARAERFGLEQSVPAAEDEKKKARLARFAPAVSKIDPVEEDKKKARALRFSKASNSPSHSNGKTIEPIGTRRQLLLMRQVEAPEKQIS